MLKQKPCGQAIHDSSGGSSSSRSSTGSSCLSLQLFPSYKWYAFIFFPQTTHPTILCGWSACSNGRDRSSEPRLCDPKESCNSPNLRLFPSHPEVIDFTMAMDVRCCGRSCVDRPSTDSSSSSSSSGSRQTIATASYKQYARGLRWKTDRLLNQQQQPATTMAKTSSWRATAGFQ